MPRSRTSSTRLERGCGLTLRGQFFGCSPFWSIRRRYSRQFGNKLKIFLLCPRSTHAGVNIASRAERKRHFGDVVAIRCLDDSHKIALARSEINMLDLNA